MEGRLGRSVPSKCADKQEHTASAFPLRRIIGNAGGAYPGSALPLQGKFPSWKKSFPRSSDLDGDGHRGSSLATDRSIQASRPPRGEDEHGSRGNPSLSSSNIHGASSMAVKSLCEARPPCGNHPGPRESGCPKRVNGTNSTTYVYPETKTGRVGVREPMGSYS